MIRIETVYTEEEAQDIFAARGITVAEREVVYNEGDPDEFRQMELHAWNPFKMRWEILSHVFYKAMREVAEDLQRERFSTMSINKIFNHVDK